MVPAGEGAVPDFLQAGAEQSEYVPNFVAETAGKIYMVETKAKSDMEDAEVQAKAEAAAKWCGHASDYARRNGGKPWVCLVIPMSSLTSRGGWGIMNGLGNNLSAEAQISRTPV